MNRLKCAIWPFGLVVEGDIASGHRSVEGLAGLGDATTGHGQLPEALRRFRGREIEVVRDSQGLCADAAQVAGRFSHSSLGPTFRIKCHPAVGAIHGCRHTAPRAGKGPIPLLRPEAQHGSICSTGRHHCVGQDLLVVLPIDPALTGNGGIIQEAEESRSGIRQFRQLVFTPLPQVLQICRGSLQQGVLLDRRVISQSSGRHFRSHRTLMQHANDRLLQHPTHHGSLQSPSLESLHQGLFPAGLDHKQHPFLGLGQQKFVGRHPLFPRWNAIKIQLDSKAAFGGHLRTTAGQTGSAHVLSSHHITAVESLETCLNQTLLKEGITDLDRRTIIQRVSTELRTGKTGTPHAVPSGCAADINDRVANSLSAGFHDLLGLHQTKSHGIHQWITGVGRIESHFTTDGGHSHAIAVMGNAGDHPFDQAHIGRILQRTETQSIEQCDWPSAHREDVAQDPPNTGRRSLKGLNRGGMVVTFDLESEAMSIAQIHHTSVFTGTHQDSWSLCWKAAQQRS